MKKTKIEITDPVEKAKHMANYPEWYALQERMTKRSAPVFSETEVQALKDYIAKNQDFTKTVKPSQDHRGEQ